MSSPTVNTSPSLDVRAGQPNDVHTGQADQLGTVSLRGIVKSYGDAPAVRGIDLEVRSGEFISLLGPSGCGKTTLLRMIAGFEHPDEGDILVGGTSVLNAPPHKRPVNTVFQSYALFPHMTVAENVGYGLRQKRVPKAEIATRVRESLVLCRMLEFADRSPQKLSGGQQQRVALARALVNRPRVLLLDEPMSALDRKLREEMQIELKLLQRQLGITFVFVTHDQQEALSMSDRIVVMQGGLIQQVGSTEHVYSEPANAFVAGFIGKQNFINAIVAAAPTNGAGVLASADGQLVTNQSIAGRAIGSAVRAAVRAEDVRVSATAPVTTSATGAAAIQGTLVGISFLGDAMQYVVLTPTGLELIARTAPAQAEPLETGATVWCSWEPTDLRVFDQVAAV
ncbi:ABC transporter ATP-binding protein [Leifsonia sp. A12D58]|uniref:ABC transporter ATP-binding protein n=1 Tax=Leifsonia sp. A12D58 TaxID=3397674 RepID=UPI0039E1BE2D